MHVHTRIARTHAHTHARTRTHSRTHTSICFVSCVCNPVCIKGLFIDGGEFVHFQFFYFSQEVMSERYDINFKEHLGRYCINYIYIQYIQAQAPKRTNIYRHITVESNRLQRDKCGGFSCTGPNGQNSKSITCCEQW